MDAEVYRTMKRFENLEEMIENMEIMWHRVETRLSWLEDELEDTGVVRSIPEEKQDD